MRCYGKLKINQNLVIKSNIYSMTHSALLYMHCFLSANSSLLPHTLAALMFYPRLAVRWPPSLAPNWPNRIKGKDLNFWLWKQVSPYSYVKPHMESNRVSTVNGSHLENRSEISLRTKPAQPDYWWQMLASDLCPDCTSLLCSLPPTSDNKYLLH
jgi:hypothetical protein